VSSDTFVEQLDNLEHRLAALWDQSHEAPPEPAVVLEELSTAVEELHVAAAELQEADRWITTERTRYEQLFHLAPDAFVTTDVHGVIQEVNRAAERLFNASSSRQQGRPLVLFVHPADRKHVGRVLDRLAMGEHFQPWRAWVLRSKADEDPIPVEVNCTVHREGDQQTVIWSLRDIRERYRADRLERESLERKRRDIEEYAARAHALEKAKSDFLDLASHELRGPMAVVRGYVSMINEGTLGPVNDRVGSVMKVISTKLEEMNRLISQMLDTARLEEERLFLNLELADLRDLARQAVTSMQPQAADKEQEIQLALPQEQVFVEVDHERLRTVITNLVDNALKYSPPDTTVTCSVEAGSDQARLTIRDQGPGLEPRAIEALFSRFGRVVTPESGDLPGAGLGLYLAREIARRHGGDVVAESSDDPGSTFTLSLPLARAPSDG
jgi:PAS domain S-box-containing protein